MKETNSEIIDQIARDGRRGGMTVPDGYFDDFAVRMGAALPFREALDVAAANQAAPRNSRWMRVRPYVYMAAMFAGAWCLIKMFTLMAPGPAQISIDNYPALSSALENEQFIDEYIIDGISTYDMIEDSYIESIDDIAAPDFTAVDNDNETPAYRLPTGGDYTSPTPQSHS